MPRGKYYALKRHSSAGGLASRLLHRAVNGAAKCPLVTQLLMGARGEVQKTRLVERKESPPSALV